MTVNKDGSTVSGCPSNTPKKFIEGEEITTDAVEIVLGSRVVLRI
jgi:hypothetical protein